MWLPTPPPRLPPNVPAPASPRRGGGQDFFRFFYVQLCIERVSDSTTPKKYTFNPYCKVPVFIAHPVRCKGPEDQCPEIRNINVAMVNRDPEIRDQERGSGCLGSVRDVGSGGQGPVSESITVFDLHLILERHSNPI